MLAPFLLTPAYRHGPDTPWGGDALRAVFGKHIPDARTGESLEASALPGLCSRDAHGTPLDTLLDMHGTALCGTAIGRRFPLLLKLIDAREALSVQVHPDDAYAAAHEGGKLGKTEAWVILHAAPGAELVYGIAENVTSQALREAALSGCAVERCLRRVRVSPGDVLYIPAGMVHAIGAGILLYEIQQSSDVTYRFWDWDRRDAAGNARALHIDKALAVTRPELRLDALSGVTIETQGESVATLYIADSNFALERLSVRGAFTRAMDGTRFAFLTALAHCALRWAGDMLALAPGDTAFIPAASPAFAIEGSADCLVAYVPDQGALRARLGGNAVRVQGLA